MIGSNLATGARRTPVARLRMEYEDAHLKYVAAEREAVEAADFDSMKSYYKASKKQAQAWDVYMKAKQAYEQAKEVQAY
mgnify:CR=1 FL=1